MALSYSFLDKYFLRAKVKKLSGEPGYYPGGYFNRSYDRGIYERGSFSLEARDLLVFEDLIAGNYLLYFGEGLLYGKNFSLILSNPYYSLSRFGNGIYPGNSYSNVSLLEGVTAVFAVGSMKIIPFLSFNHFDSSCGESDYYKYNDNDYDGLANDEDPDDFTDKPDEGISMYSSKNDIYKSINDELSYDSDSYRERRNKLVEYIAGINASINSESFILGATLSFTAFNRIVDPYFNYSTDCGDKTAHFFRGRSYTSASLYFRYFDFADIFGEVAGSYYKSISFYEDFNNSKVFSMAVAGGIRKKLRGIYLSLWGAYVPANFVNPHSLEYPWGRNNYIAFVASAGFTESGKKNFLWFVLSKEIFDEYDPGENEEASFSCNYEYRRKLGSSFEIKGKNRVEIVENDYYYPYKRMERVYLDIGVVRYFENNTRIKIFLAGNSGTVTGKSRRGGIGLGSRFTIKKWKVQTHTLQLFYYKTDHSRLAMMYPYEPSLYRWSFLPQGVMGDGILISFSAQKNIRDRIVFGVKVRYDKKLDRNRNDVFKIYFTSELEF